MSLDFCLQILYPTSHFEPRYHTEIISVINCHNDAPMSISNIHTQPPERITNSLGVQEKQGLGGHTCLHLAVMSDKVEIVRMLLNSGADGAAVADVSDIFPIMSIFLVV